MPDSFTMLITILSLLVLIIFAVGIYIPTVKAKESEFSMPGADMIVQITKGCFKDDDCGGNGICVDGECICFKDSDCLNRCNLATGKCVG